MSQLVMLSDIHCSTLFFTLSVCQGTYLKLSFIRRTISTIPILEISFGSPTADFGSIWSFQKLRKFQHVQQNYVFSVLTPNHTKINYCCSTHLFYSMLKAASIYSGILPSRLLAFWSSQMSLVLLPWQPRYLIVRTGSTMSQWNIVPH